MCVFPPPGEWNVKIRGNKEVEGVEVANWKIENKIILQHLYKVWNTKLEWNWKQMQTMLAEVLLGDPGWSNKCERVHYLTLRINLSFDKLQFIMNSVLN